ncbi:hypothetical protein M408DRAFT_281348 [Serendipita vermifera MAFF 305830]|uniref:N-alpha-acetyltransferase 40 n=1 Tax=Serendipita vermifera MAFF 305830 TaxID=933852 RepID=A0A0C3ADN4_SERVB|nr:hypothetical protein M408DRAFT_281348 [Serendipita vermifera MAFF 305830]
MKHPNVSAANLVPIVQLARDLPATFGKYSVALYGGMEVSKELRDGIWSIFEANMKSLLERSTDGWDPPQKELEWFHPHSRLILVMEADNLVDTCPTRRTTKTATKAIAGFGVFRFDTEMNENDDEDEYEVLYCYELQTAASARRQGIGRQLMEWMKMFGAKHKMHKVMLTCQKENEGALAFYRSMGFENDPICPSQWTDGSESESESEAEDDEAQGEVDYVILSLPLK